FPPVTYSIVGRDETNGELGVAVQSRAFGVGLCAWARAGVGAIATQSFTERSYGPLGLDLLAGGNTPGDALAELLEADDQSDLRVDNHDDPLRELRRLHRLAVTYRRRRDFDEETDLDEEVELARAAGLPPDQVALTGALVALKRDDVDAAAAQLKPIADADPR